MHFRSQKKLQGEVSLSESIESDRDGNSFQLMDVIRCDDQMLEEIDLSDRRGLLHRYLAEELDGREREILALRYGLGGREPRTQRETAEKLGISRSYVSRIEKKALAKLAGRFGEG